MQTRRDAFRNICQGEDRRWPLRYLIKRLAWDKSPPSIVVQGKARSGRSVGNLYLWTRIRGPMYVVAMKTLVDAAVPGRLM